MNLSNKNPTHIGDHNTNVQSQSQGLNAGGSVLTWELRLKIRAEKYQQRFFFGGFSFH